METIEHTLKTLVWLVRANPIPAAVIGLMLLAVIISIAKKLFKLAFILSVMIIASAIVLHYFGYDTLPPGGKELLQDTEEFIQKKM
jgi:hypothetical protein